MIILESVQLFHRKLQLQMDGALSLAKLEKQPKT